MTSPLFAIPFIDQAQTAYLDHNEAVSDLEAVGAGVVLNRTLTAPPGSPNDGDIYIPAAVATGAWVGFEDLLVQWRTNLWRVITPYTNFIIYDVNASEFIQWNGAAWVALPGVSNTDQQVRISANDTTSDYLATKLIVGANTTLTENNDGANETLTVDTHLLNRETLAATKTIVNTDDTVQALDPDGVARDVVLPVSPTDDKFFVIINDSDGVSASGNTINIKETGAGPVVLTLDDTTSQMYTNCIYDDNTSTWVFWS